MTEETVPKGLADAYVLTPDGIKDPPTGWAQSLRYLGPGVLLSAAVVGSGELIATTALGAQVGFILLWLVVISTLIKVAVQLELARWTILTGTPALGGFNKVPPRVKGVGWISVLWILMMVTRLLQLGGIIGGVAAACSILLPISGQPLGPTSMVIWTIIIVALDIGLMYSNRYSWLERGAFVLVVMLTAITVGIAFGLSFTPFAYGGEDMLSGLAFSLPAGAVGAAVAMFGITGVGPNEMSLYTYWCLEKGYARWTGPNDGSEAWRQRARGWVKVMYKDAMVSWMIYTVGTLAFFVMGAAVLHPQGFVPEGNGMITTLSQMYTDTIGEWTSVVFLLGAIAALGSTMFHSTVGQSRLFTHMLGIIGLLDWSNARTRQLSIRTFIVILPVVWGAAFLLFQAPVLMVQIGGFAAAVFLLAVVTAVLYLHKTEIGPRLGGGWLFNAFLALSSAVLFLLGAYSLVKIFGVSIS